MEIFMSAIHWAALVESTSSCVFVGQNMAQKAFDHRIFLNDFFLLQIDSSAFIFLLCSSNIISIGLTLYFLYLKKKKIKMGFSPWNGNLINLQLTSTLEKPDILFLSKISKLPLHSLHPSLCTNRASAPPSSSSSFFSLFFCLLSSP